ncbi:MAG: type III secretion system chaperone [Minwuiales bacterium]|nr:type III secretion system chaperone [Minwuiales bacterium]
MTQGIQTEALEDAIQQAADSTWTRKDVDGLISQFAGRVGAPGLELNEDGVAWMAVDDDIEISLVHCAHLPGLVVAAAMPLDAIENGTVLRALLQANMSWAKTRGGVFAMVPPANVAMLCRLIPFASLEAGALERQVAEFVELVQDWHAEIDAYFDSVDDGHAATAEAATPPQLRV